MEDTQRISIDQRLDSSHSTKNRLLVELSEQLIDRQPPIIYSPGAILTTQGSTADLFYLVLSGMIKVYFPRPNGTRILMRLAGPGDVIGFMDDIDARGRHVHLHELEAFTKSSVAPFTRERVAKLLAGFDRAKLFEILEEVNIAWSSIVEWLSTFLGMSYEERLKAALRDLGSRFGIEDTRGILIIPELTHSDLAEMIGSSRPMVSKVLAEMIDQGYLLRQGRQYILVRGVLREN